MLVVVQKCHQNKKVFDFTGLVTRSFVFEHQTVSAKIIKLCMILFDKKKDDTHVELVAFESRFSVKEITSVSKCTF